MNAWRVFFSLIILSEAAMLYLFCGYCCDYRFERYNWLVLPPVLLLYPCVMLVGDAFTLPGQWSGLVFFLLDYLSVRLVFEMRRVRAVVYCASYYAMVTVADLAVIVLLEQVFGVPRELLLAAGPLLCLEPLVARLLVLVMVQVIPRKLLPERFYVENTSLLFFGITPLVSSLLILGLLLYDGLLLEIPGLHLIFLLVWWLNVSNLYYFNSRERARQRLMQLQADRELAWEQRLQEQKLGQFAAELDRLVHNQRFDFPSEQELAVLHRFSVYTGNVLIDVILGHFWDQAAGAGIAFTVTGKLPRGFVVDRRDLRIILGNLLQNALEACQAVEQEQGTPPFIRFTASYGPQGLFIEVANSAKPGLPTAFPHQSSKRGGAAYGHGETTIRKIIEEKYHGSMLTQAGDGCYRVRLVLPLEVEDVQNAKCE